MEATDATASGHEEGTSAPEITIDTKGNVALPLTKLLTGRTFLTGKSGSGKSNSVSVIAEELLTRGIPLLIVDTEGEYIGLKEKFEVLHAGAQPDADVSISTDDGGEVARVALSRSIPTILDISEFFDEDAVEGLVEDVARTLFQLEKDERKPFLLVVEECHEFIPQTGSPDVADVLTKVAKRGRKRGLGLCGLSQRPAAVDKDFITQCDLLVWHRLTWHNDTDVVQDVVDRNHADSVTDLDDGEAFVVSDWSEEIQRVQWRRKETPDLGSAPDIERAIGTAPSKLPTELDIGTNHEGGDTVAVQVADDELGRYQVLDAGFCNQERMFSHLDFEALAPLDVSPGDVIGVAVRDGGVYLTAGGAGVVLEYQVHEAQRGVAMKAGVRLCELVDARPGDHIRVRGAGDEVAVDVVRDFEPHNPSAVLVRSVAKKQKDAGSGADTLYLGGVACRYLGIEEGDRLTVSRNEVDNPIVKPGETSGATYKVYTSATEPHATIGSRGCDLIGVEAGDIVVGYPDRKERIELQIQNNN